MTEGPYHPPNQPPGPQPGQQPGQYYPMAPVAPNSSKATTSLVLGICSLVACGLFLGIPAMVVGRRAKREIAESRGRLGGEGLATAGFVTGLIGTIWSVLGVVVLVLVVAVGGVVGDHIAKNCHEDTDANGNSTLTCN
jgi:hypothetical protein